MNVISTKCLNTLKFLAACVVAFFWHYQHFAPSHGFPFSSIFEWCYSYGYLMVELFFTLSGFGMFLGYAEKIQDHKITFKEYILRRLKKIYPLFLFTLFLVTILESWHEFLAGDTFVYPNFDYWHLFLNLILCQDGIFGTEWSFNSPSWCISICFILYAIFFAAAYFSKNKRNLIFFFAGAFFLGASILSMQLDYPFLLNSLFGRGISCFSIGVILAAVYQVSEKLNTRLIGYVSLFTLIVYYCIFRSDADGLGNMTLLYIMLISPATVFSVLYIPWLNRLFSFKLMLYLGSLSLEIYLLHFITQCAIRDIDLSFDLELDYSLPHIWFLYFLAAIISSAVYERFLAKRVYRVLSMLAKRFINEQPPSSADQSG